MKYIIIYLIIFITHFSCKPTLDYTLLENKIIKILNSQKGDFAVAFKNLSNGKTILINEKEKFHAASTMKTPVMIEVFKKAQKGIISLDDSIKIKN